MQKLKSFFYGLYKFKMNYTIDKEGMVVWVKVNKPDKDIYIFGDDRAALNTLCSHFTAAGYCVLVRD